jgi:hypothetical protein
MRSKPSSNTTSTIKFHLFRKFDIFYSFVFDSLILGLADRWEPPGFLARLDRQGSRDRASRVERTRT